MKRHIVFYFLLEMALMTVQLSAAALGLLTVPIPADQPQSAAKIALGKKLFHDTRTEVVELLRASIHGSALRCINILWP